MPVIDEEKFSKMLKNGLSGNIFFLFGEDTYLKDYYCEKLIDLTVDENLRFFNLHTYQDDETDLETIFADADNLPMMADKTCLLVRNFPLASLNADALKKLESQLRDIPETTILVFFYNALEVQYTPYKYSKWNAVVNLFAKCGFAVQLDHRTPERMAKMLVSKAKTKGTSIDPEEALYLVQCVGDDMQTLMNEFNKICAFSEGEKITKEMIDRTAVKSVEATVYDIGLAICSGDIDKAFSILNEVLRQKTEVQLIIGALANTYVNIYRYKIALNAGKGYNDFAETFNYKNASLAFRDLSAFTRKSTIGSIRKAIGILSEADVRAKSTKVDERIFMTEVIAKLASCS